MLHLKDKIRFYCSVAFSWLFYQYQYWYQLMKKGSYQCINYFKIPLSIPILPLIIPIFNANNSLSMHFALLLKVHFWQIVNRKMCISVQTWSNVIIEIKARETRWDAKVKKAVTVFIDKKWRPKKKCRMWLNWNP